MMTNSFVWKASVGTALVAALAYASAPGLGVEEGTQLRTALVPSEVVLGSGVDVRLAARSALTLYNDHVVLDQGSLRVANFPALTVDAGQLQVNAADHGAQAVIRLTGKTIEVASLGGYLNVVDGPMLTRVASGTRIAFQQSAAPASQTGAGPARKRLPSDQHTMIWLIGITAAAALAIGLTAAAQGKSPF